MEADTAEGYAAVMKLASKLVSAERDTWLKLVRACYRLTNPSGRARFAKKWLGGELASARFNLRRLHSCGILERDGLVVRGGHRAYWRIRDPEGVRQALSKLGYL